MSLVPRAAVATVRKDGASIAITLPKPELRRLGWNPGDLISFTVVGKTLAMVRVELPKVDDLRRG